MIEINNLYHFLYTFNNICDIINCEIKALMLYFIIKPERSQHKGCD
jgi:hypothetical protein